MATTLLGLVEDGAARLRAAGVAFGHGTADAFDEAAWLVLWSLGLPPDALAEGAVADRRVDGDEARAAAALIARRIDERVPAAYLTGQAWLHGVPFSVDRRSIVPRSLVAEPMLETGFAPWLAAPPRRVLDLCCGNGSLAVLAAKAWPRARVDAADVDADALGVARDNVARHRLGRRVALHLGDGFAALDALAPAPRYELIVCNPPYVCAASMAALPAEHRAEPALALAGGADGMDVIRRLLPRAAAFLAPGGGMALEVGHERAHFDAAFPALAPAAVGLPTSAGDDAVLWLDRDALARAFPASR